MRRWYVAVPVLVLTIGATAAVFFSVPTQYTATGTAVLTMPPAGASVSGDPADRNGTVNPLLAFDGSLEVSAKLEVATFADPAVLATMAAAGGTAQIEAGDGGLKGPFILINATSTSAATSQRTVQLAFEHVQNELTSRQDRLGAPRSTYITVEQVVSATPGQPLIGGKVRAAGVAFALGLIASVCSAFMIESFKQRRRVVEQEESGPVEQSAVHEVIPPRPSPARPSPRKRLDVTPSTAPPPGPLRRSAVDQETVQVPPLRRPAPRPTLGAPVPDQLAVGLERNYVNGSGNGHAS